MNQLLRTNGGMVSQQRVPPVKTFKRLVTNLEDFGFRDSRKALI